MPCREHLVDSGECCYQDSLSGMTPDLSDSGSGQSSGHVHFQDRTKITLLFDYVCLIWYFVDNSDGIFHVNHVIFNFVTLFR